VSWRPWRSAWATALYGPDGFYRTPGAARAHFRTSVDLADAFAAAVAELLDRVDAALSRPRPLWLVDVGAADGRLLTAVGEVLPVRVRARWRPHAVEVTSRALPAGVCGLVFANEWLDNLPVDVVADGRLVDVDRTGAEQPGATPRADVQAWATRWSPASRVVEVGLVRDRAWRGVLRRLRRGVAVAVDYATGPAAGRTLAGYRAGRLVAPVPDGRCDLTAHVRFDAVAAAGRRAGATAGRLLSQRAALRALGCDPALPSRALAETDPAGYLAALARADAAGELTRPDGLGSRTWLVQAVGVPLPLPGTLR
jgi:SAM-dependent MidA family methyltransferase